MSAPNLDLTLIEAGSITLRDARTRTAREVDVRSYSIARTPVTWALYEAVRGGKAANLPHPDSPAHSVSWLEAVQWCNTASRACGLAAAYAIDGATVRWDPSADGYRLPTEAEWEYACRAGSAGPRYGPLSDIAWTAADQVECAQVVGLKQPNDFGLFDMLGNVWEWCWDYSDPARYADYRTLRGGGWADEHWSVRASVRRGSMPDAQIDDVGFRVARGAVGDAGDSAAQGWSARADRERAEANGQPPFGWTPLRR